MKLILTTPIEKLGVAGDIIEVKDGYGRNYLLPQGHAIKWTKGAESQIETIKRARDAREIKGLEHAQQVRDQLENLAVKVVARVADGGRLFGGVTVNDVISAVRKAGGPAIDKRTVEIDKPIKTVGAHTVGIKLHPAVTAHIKLEVVSE